jgi:signal transduction histidine kinase
VAPRPHGSSAPGDQPSGEAVIAGRAYELTASALPDRRGRPSGAVLIARDVTERRALDEMKDAFLHAVSHDLRTPLTSVLGIAATLHRGQELLPAAEFRDLLGRLDGNARRLDRLVTNLLDLERLARGTVTPDRRPVDVAELVGRVVKDTGAELLGDRPIGLETSPVVIAVDGAKVERIVENLLANAARHTSTDTAVWVRVEQCAGGALIVVDDAGPGVPAEVRQAIFQPFQRGPSITAHAPGSGVGLALVAQFAAMHGGRAWVQERPLGGASFRVFLPKVGDPDQE